MDVLANAAIQMAGIAVVGFIFLQVLKMVLDAQGKKLDKLTAVGERQAEVILDLRAEIRGMRHSDG